MDDTLDAIFLKVEQFLDETTKNEEQTESDSLSSLVYDFILSLSGDEIGFLIGYFQGKVEGCWRDPDETALRIAAARFTEQWNAKKTKEDVYVDESGVVYSKDKRELIRFPYSLSIDKYQVLPECESIRDGAFEEELVCIDTYEGDHYDFACNTLKEVILPEGLLDVSFAGCERLERIRIPSTVKSIILPDALLYLKSIDVSNSNSNYDSRERCNAIIDSSKDELILGCSKTFIPYGVKSIASKAFATSKIENLIVPSSVRHIGGGAFESCSELKTLSLRSTELVIDNAGAFLDKCYSLESIELHSKIEGLSHEMFLNFRLLKQVFVSFNCYDYYRRLFSYTPIISKLKVIDYGRA